LKNAIISQQLRYDANLYARIQW